MMKWRWTIMLWALVVSLGTVSDVKSEPWVEAGDTDMRRDIELLASYSIIKGPVTMWPMPWAQITDSLANMPQRAFPVHVEAALARVRAGVPSTQDYRGLGYEAYGGATSREKTMRGFDGGVRENVDLGVSAEKHWGSTYAKLSLGWRDGQPGKDVHFDNSYLAKALGNWVVYGGTLDQWWGGGWDAGMILSNNARPFPRVGIQRLNPKPFETKWLSWLGPWNINITTGRLDGGETRTDFDHPLVMHMRVTFQPLDRLDIGFSRAIQICGKDRPCGFSTWTDALIAVGDRDNTGTFDEPGNQLAGGDIRYSWVMGSLSYATYAEFVAEDEKKGLPDKFSVLFGATLDGYWASRDLQWRLRGEVSDTFAGNIFGISNKRRANITYTNFIYRDGFEFLDRTIGHSLSTDSQLYTGELTLTDKKANSYWLRYRYAKINKLSLSANEQSGNREAINMVEAGMTARFDRGEARVEVRLMDDRPNTPGRSKADAQIEASWRWRF